MPNNGALQPETFCILPNDYVFLAEALCIFVNVYMLQPETFCILPNNYVFLPEVLCIFANVYMFPPETPCIMPNGYVFLPETFFVLDANVLLTKMHLQTLLYCKASNN